jgi:hypothetical protein
VPISVGKTTADFALQPAYLPQGSGVFRECPCLS